MKLDQITKKTDKELMEFIDSTRAELAKTVLESRSKEVRDTKAIGRLKKTISRTLTIAREREIAKMEATK